MKKLMYGSFHHINQLKVPDTGPPKDVRLETRRRLSISRNNPFIVTTQLISKDECICVVLSACTHNTSSNRRMHVLLIILQQTLIVSPHPAKLRCCLCEGGVDHLRCYLNAHWSRQDNACMCVSLHSGQTERKCNISEIEIAVFTAAPIFPCEICTFPKGFYAAVKCIVILFSQELQLIV